jgi:hypothetical protein
MTEGKIQSFLFLQTSENPGVLVLAAPIVILTMGAPERACAWKVLMRHWKTHRPWMDSISVRVSVMAEIRNLPRGLGYRRTKSYLETQRDEETDERVDA